MTTKEAIEKRRSIRNYKSNPIPETILKEILESARLAPSGRNCQPWCFKIVTDKVIIEKLSIAANNQTFIAKATTVIVCCANIKHFKEYMTENYKERMEYFKTQTREQISYRLAIQVAIAIEHMVLRAMDFELGTCWIRSIKEKEVRDIFGWDENIFIVALLLVGYPNENPKPKPRLSLDEILI